MRLKSAFSTFALVLAACAAPEAADVTVTGATTLSAEQHLQEGERLWRSSCAAPGVAGLCVERAAFAAGGRCGVAPALRLAVVARDAAAVAAARGHLQQALELLRADAAADPSRAPLAARAHFLLGEDATERVLANVFPADLDFDPANAEVRSRSEQRFKAFIADFTGDLTAARTAYLAVVELGTAELLPSAARVAQLYERYASEIVLAPIPVDVARDADARLAYCDALADEAEKLYAQADASRAECRESAARLADATDAPDAPACDVELEPRVLATPRVTP